MRKGNRRDWNRLFGVPHPFLGDKAVAYGHDGSNSVSGSEIKAMHQAEIREKYGVPAVIIDDRMENRDAVIEVNPGIA